MQSAFSCVVYILSETYNRPRGKSLLKKGGSIMRFHDVQDLTKTIKSEQRNAAYKRMHDAFLDRLSVFNSNKRMTVFGATFIF